MCGIVGYVGESNCVDFILDGLKHLEYRGYDSAGIALAEQNSVKIFKKCGRLEELENLIKKVKPQISHCGIGHTRWATHGKPTNINSHPHQQNNVTIVHNGIMENYEEIKEDLKEKNYKFKSQTDSEVVAALIDSLYENDPVDAIVKATKIIEGSYALGIIFKDKKDTIYAVKKDNPLIIGYGQNENFLASDIPAIISKTKKYSVLETNEIAVLKKDCIEILDFNKKKIEKNVLTINWDVEQAEKNGFSHYMIKEIFEQPETIKKFFNKHILKQDLNLKIENLPNEKIKKIKKIHIIACGTAMHAGLIGKHLIETFAKIPVEVDYASEFRYKNHILQKDDLVILISQSGETADTLAALQISKQKNIFTLSIVNVFESSIARQSDSVIYTLSGPEIAVASTKAFTSQIAALFVLTLKLAKIFKKIEKKELQEYCKILKNMPKTIKKVLRLNDEILDYAKTIYKEKDLFFIGREIDYCIALESSLKLKEISYIHSEAYAAGELKHGTISLIEKNTPVVALATQSNVFSKTMSNVKEVIARGAKVLLICNEDEDLAENAADKIIKIPKTLDCFSPIYSIIPMQLLSYHVAVLKGCDVDKPRNLAKSVTVE